MSTFNLAPITDYMVLKITVDNNASPENLAAYPYCQIGRTENESGADWDVAEILGYSNALSPSDEALVGGYLAAKYGIATAYPATGSLANQAATAITTTSATLNATLMCNSNTYDVVAYWGPVNGGIEPRQLGQLGLPRLGAQRGFDQSESHAHQSGPRHDLLLQLPRHQRDANDLGRPRRRVSPRPRRPRIS